MASNTSLAILPEIVASTMRASRPLNAAGDTREAVISTLSRLSALDNSPMTQLAASLACERTEARHHRLEIGAELAARAQDAGIVSGQAEIARKSRGLLVRQLRQTWREPPR